jgi:restriction system protein
MRSYYRIMPGRGGKHAQLCREGGFIGGDFEPNVDLTPYLTGDRRSFLDAVSPQMQACVPEAPKGAISIWSGYLYTIAEGMAVGDVVLAPDGTGRYLVGEVTGGYSYAAGQTLPHRRAVQWSTKTIARADMSKGLQNSSGSIGTTANISSYRDEIEALIGPDRSEPVTVADPTVEDPMGFVLERHLEDFLFENWALTELGRTHDIYEVNGEPVGRQLQTDTGPLDILAISKDRSELLVVELKKGRASDNVVGQVLRYMGFVGEEIAEEGQSVRGVIIALEDDLRIRRALSVTPNIRFLRYEVRFRLVEGNE